MSGLIEQNEHTGNVRENSHRKSQHSSGGRWRKRLGRFKKVSTYKVCGIGINAGVGQRCRARGVESSALQATTAKRVTFHRGDGGNVADGSKCKHSHTAGAKIASTRTAVGQLLSSRASSMGRWRKCLGKGRRPAYFTRFVRIHVGVGQRGRARYNESSALSKNTSA